MSDAPNINQSPVIKNAKQNSEHYYPKVNSVSTEAQSNKSHKPSSNSMDANFKTNKSIQNSANFESPLLYKSTIRSPEIKTEFYNHKNLRAQKSDGNAKNMLYSKTPFTPTRFSHDSGKTAHHYTQQRTTKSNEIPELEITSRQYDSKPTKKSKPKTQDVSSTYLEFQLTARDKNSSSSSSDSESENVSKFSSVTVSPLKDKIKIPKVKPILETRLDLSPIHKDDAMRRISEDYNNLTSEEFHKDSIFLYPETHFSKTNSALIYCVGWNGIIILKSGFYKSGIFKFQINYQDRYPDDAKVIFDSSIYHPLINEDNRELDLIQCEKPRNLRNILKFIKKIFHDSSFLGYLNSFNREAALSFGNSDKRDMFQGFARESVEISLNKMNELQEERGENIDRVIKALKTTMHMQVEERIKAVLKAISQKGQINE